MSYLIRWCRSFARSKSERRRFLTTTCRQALETFRKSQEEAGHDVPSELLPESMAFDFCEDYQQDEGGWGTYYGPMWTVPRAGQVYERPSIQHVTPDILEYWQARSQEVNHPLLRIRYADLVWDFSPKIRERSADIACAHTAVDSTVELVTKRWYGHAPDIRSKLERALGVALSIKDKERVNQVAKAIIALEKDAAELDKPWIWGFGFDLLVENKKVPLCANQEQRFIDCLEDHLAKAATINGDSGYPRDHFAARDAAIRLARYYERKMRRDDVRRVLSLYAAAVKAIAKKVMAMLGVEWLRQVYDVLVQYGVNDEADSVAVLMRELGQGIQKEMVRTTHTVEIPKEEMDAFIASMMAGTEDEVVSRICRTFVPDLEKVEEQLHHVASRFPLWNIFDQGSIDDEGREISRVGSVKDDLEGRIVQQTSQNMALERLWLGVALQEWVKRFDVSADRLVERLQWSPLFPPDRQNLIRCGVDAYLRGDHISSVHVLVPQTEHAFRCLLVLRGQSTYKPGRHGGLNLKTLDDMLRDAVTAQVFGEDCVRYFRILLTDQRGWNLRNNVCHGLTNFAPSNSAVTDRIIHVLLALSMARRAGHQQGNSPESNSGGS